MDIHKWLDDTADRLPPDLSEDANKPDFIQDHRDKSDRPGRSYRYKRKRPSSDSSIIAPRPTIHLQAKAATSSPTSNRFHAADDSSERISGSRHSASAHNSAQRQPAKTYDKRPRHKTRPDRYEPKSNKRRKDDDAKRERKSGQKGRKSHRSGDGGRTTGLVQSFRLNNGPKNNRLTLKQDATVGIFAHGKSSAQMTGRGSGLPDLFFNELRFLQKAEDAQDKDDEPCVQRKADTKNQSNKSKRHEEEVSAYFNAQKVTDVQQRAHNADEQQRKGDQSERHPDKRKDDSIKPSTPPVELPDKAFLGFGSKGRQHQDQRRPDEHTSFYTWSESAPQVSRPAQEGGLTAQLGSEGANGALKQDKRQDVRKRHTANLAESTVEHVNINQNDDNDTGRWMQSRRTRGPAIVEVYQPPKATKDHHTHSRTSATKSTQQSLPRPSSTRADSEEKNASRQSRRQLVADDYQTSDILDVHVPRQADTQRVALQRTHTSNDTSNEKENHDPSSSFTVDKLLDKVRDTVNRPGPAMDFLRRGQAASNGSIDSNTAQVKCWAAENHRRSQQRLPNPEHGRHQARPIPQHGLDPVPLTHRTHTSAHRPSRRRDLKMMVDEYDNPIERAAAFVHAQDYNDMLDDARDAEPPSFINSFVYANSRQAEDLVHGVTLDRAPGMYEQLADRLGCEASLEPSMSSGQSGVSKIRSMRGMPIEQDFRSVRSASPPGDDVDELVGFWKPHKLY